MTTVVLVHADQLSRHAGPLAAASPDTHEVLMVTSEAMLRSRRWHVQRLFLVLSAAEHFRQELRSEGFTVHHEHAPSMGAALDRHDGARIVSGWPSSHHQVQLLQSRGVELVDNGLFLTSRADFARWAGNRSTLRMDTFYRWQRTRLDILMDGDGPEGGTWSLDSENRLPPPKGDHPWPAPPVHERDTIDREVLEMLRDGGYDVAGADPDGTWATTRVGALRQLDHFLEHAFAGFGPYEDAMPTGTWAANHSLLSPYLNLGLLHPREVVDAALARYRRGGIPLASCEGFVRQVIGWREYINGVYWHLDADYRTSNSLEAHRALPPALNEPGRTQMACVSGIVGDIQERGWVHHIPRLMVLANLALLTGIDPTQFLDWMRRSFVDAADWVMVPNVIGMGVHADGGQMMTKPYAAGGAYISRMGQYCRGCRYDPKARTGDDACPFTTLYWDFLDRHRDRFAANPRMAQQVRGLDRLADLPDVRERARMVLALLDEGSL